VLKFASDRPGEQRDDLSRSRACYARLASPQNPIGDFTPRGSMAGKESSTLCARPPERPAKARPGAEAFGAWTSVALSATPTRQGRRLHGFHTPSA